jgi:tetratricopeptide (TPR) repeat protein
MNDWLEAEQRVERAQQLSESARWEEALAEIDAALEINPNNAVWHAHRGCILDELDRWEDAVEAYGTALNLEPADRDVAVAYGLGLCRLERFGQALEVFEELARLNPDFEPAYCHRIGIYGELGRHDQAEQMFYLAQELDASCPNCFFNMGVSLAARGQFDRAIYCWQRVLELEPGYIGVHARIAQAHRAQGDADLAREFYLRELREDPGNTDLLYELAELTLESGDIEMAAAKFAQIVELDPTDAESHFALGKTLVLRGDARRALACFEAAASASGDGGASLPAFDWEMGKTLARLGRFAEACERLGAAIEKDAQNIDALTLLGDCRFSLNKPADAADAFRRVLAIDVQNPYAHHRLGVCLFRQGRYTAGIEHCLQAIQAKPDHVQAMLAAIVGYLFLGRWREARSMLRRALRLDPANPQLQHLKKRFWRYRARRFVHKLLSPFIRVFGPVVPHR